MDKYTVDLDKVLNDFEYSELTEQTTVDVSSCISNCYASTSSENRSRNSNAKHSINNVFNSLNEYLNTDISGKPKDINVTTNNQFRKIKDPVTKSKVNINDVDEKKADPLEGNKKLYNLSEALSELPPKITYQSIYDKSQPSLASNCNSRTNFNDFANNGNKEPENWLIPDISCSNDEYQSSQSGRCLENNEFVGDFKGCDENLLNQWKESGGNIKKRKMNTEEYGFDQMAKENHENVEELQDILLDMKIDGKYDECVVARINKFDEESKINVNLVGECGDEISKVSVKDTINEQNRKVFDNGISLQEKSKLNEIYNNIGDMSKLLEELPKKIENISMNVEKLEAEFLEKPKNMEVMCKPVVILNEVGKSVDKMEAQIIDMSKTMDVVCKPVEVLNEEAKTTVEIAKAMEEESKSATDEEETSVESVSVEDAPKNLELPTGLHKNMEEELPESMEALKISTEVSDDANVAENYELPKLQETSQQEQNVDGLPTYAQVVSVAEDTEKTVLASAPAPVGFDLNFEIDDSELNQYLEILEEELERKSENTSFSVETREPARTVDLGKAVIGLQEKKVQERPNSLELDKSDKKRQINLIGNPGSTPYNNVYVSKEIPTEKHRNPPPYESESSASVSPTFSEASTDSIRSTESTDTDTERGNVAGAIVPDEEASKVIAEEDLGNVDNETPTSSSTVVEAGQNAENRVEAGDFDQNIVEQPIQETASAEEVWVGTRAPLWIPDADALNCLHCDVKFTVLKRRHHCRACGLVLCSKCCNLKHRLEYLDQESRVCTKCYEILMSRADVEQNRMSGTEPSAPSEHSPGIQPNPNNPMEYCSQVPPLQQMNSGGDLPPTVMVPVGVLKRKGSNKAKHNKSVMFCDGIRPGSDLTNLDNDFNYNETRTSSKRNPAAPKINRNQPLVDPTTKSFIPEQENCLPPIITRNKTDVTYTDCANNAATIDVLKAEINTFALQKNLLVHLKLINMECCINKQAWCFSTEGLISVGQDEIVILLEYTDNETMVPKDVFYHLNNIYNDALKGTTVTELGISMHSNTNFLDSKNHAGFLYIRPSFQCLQNVIVPKEPYLIGLLIHRWETPWAKIFPLRLILRLGAEYRYYPSPLISTRNRDSVFVEIGQTIINLLADFRNFTYTLPSILGLSIHMEDKNTTVMLPANRYDQVMKSLNDSTDHILAFGGNFSATADSHLVCIQDLHGNNENAYTTHAINIQNKPRKVTGASFIVFNGALKTSSGLTAKSSIVEDGLMIQIPAEHMVHLRESLRNMKNHTIQCGCVNATSDETVNIVWGDPDVNFNVGIKSSVDEQSLSGVPSIRVHNGQDFVCNSGNRLLRWTEVFLLQNGEENARTQDPMDISKIAESISKATCQALVKYLDLLATNNFYKIGIRATLHVENVSYSAGSNGIKLPPIYMRSLDNELVPVLHRITSSNLGENAIVLELIFRILNV